MSADPSSGEEPTLTNTALLRSEREAIDRWAEASSNDIVATSRALLAISQRVTVWAAVSALRALLADAKDDPLIDPTHLERGGLLADAVEAWLAKPSDERLVLVDQRTRGTEALWNDLAGDTGQPEPILAAATCTGWCVIHPDQLYNLTPALNEAGRRIGAERVLESVRSALAGDPPWA
jgi:hypothetical protein